MKDEAFWLLIGKSSAGLASAAFLVASFYYSNSATRIREARRKYNLPLSRLSHNPVLGRLSIALVMLLFPFVIASGLLAQDRLVSTAIILLLLAVWAWGGHHVWVSPPGRGWRGVTGMLTTSAIIAILATLAVLQAWSVTLPGWQLSVLKCLALLALLAGLIWVLIGVAYAARHQAVFAKSERFVDSVDDAKQRVQSSWEGVVQSYTAIHQQRDALTRALGRAVLEHRLRHAAADKREFDRRVRAVIGYSTAQRFFSLYEVLEFFDEVKRLEKDLTDWTAAVLSHLQVVRIDPSEPSAPTAV